jgi:oligopeptide/dipeptide ABC transporter ATP-binding protein
MGRAEVLAVERLKMHYVSKTRIIRAVEDLSFSISQGETFGLVGESGCGKSAACRTIIRLLPDNGRILGGGVFFCGRELTRLGEREMVPIRGRGISMIFQEPMTALNPVLTIRTQLFEALGRQGLSRSARYGRAAELLRLVEIPEPEKRLGQYIHQFSGGMRQRVMIAIALASNPKLLLADEPTTALDVTIQRQIILLLEKLKRELGMSVLLVTHDLGVIRMTCDRVAVMYAGYIVETADTDLLFTDPRHPYTRGLIHSLPRDHDDRERLEPIPGSPPDQSEKSRGCPFAPRCAYADPRCTGELPGLREWGPGHTLRCHHPEKLPAHGLKGVSR